MEKIYNNIIDDYHKNYETFVYYSDLLDNKKIKDLSDDYIKNELKKFNSNDSYFDNTYQIIFQEELIKRRLLKIKKIIL